MGSLGARTRQRIAETALECFTEKGFHGTVIEDIASRAGVSRATLYQYFESKEAIFLELIQEGGADFLYWRAPPGRSAPIAKGSRTSARGSVTGPPRSTSTRRCSWSGGT